MIKHAKLTFFSEFTRKHLLFHPKKQRVLGLNVDYISIDLSIII